MKTKRFDRGIYCSGFVAAALCVATPLIAQSAQPVQGRAELVQALDQEAATYTAARRALIAGIKTRGAAQHRQQEVRAKLLQLIGGLPQRTPLRARVLGSTQLAGFHIEKVLFESQPGFYVTALLYVPEDEVAKHAAVVMAPGHGPTGKAGDARTAEAFVRNGFVVLSYDPIGQGERLQYPDPADGSKSLASRPTGEHGEAGLQPVLIGDAPARYWAWDGIRAVDYLTSRPEVDSARIGAFGCSGGGTITSLTAALDPRIAATAVACYNTSFDALLPSVGPQDGEQSTPGVIAAGLDFADWIELVAPRPYAAVATYSDMFPFVGARATVQEARRFYALFNPSALGGGTGAAEENATVTPAGPALNADTTNRIPPSAPMQFITGPGGHGALSPILADILGFFVRNLQPGADATRIKLPTAATKTEIPANAMQVTPTGQVNSSYPNAETVATLNRRRARQLLATRRPPVRGAALLAAVKAVTGAAGKPGVARFDAAQLQAASGPITLHVSAGIELRGHIAVPRSAGKHPAVLMLVPNDIDGPGEIAQTNRKRLDHLVQAGNVVLAVTPRPSYPGTDDMKSPLLGPFYLLSLRAELVGHTLLGLRVDDALAAMDYLAARSDVDGQKITAEGAGHMATVLEHAALMDARIAHINAQGGLDSYRSLVNAAMPIGAPEDIVPGVLRHYDLPDVRAALGSRLTVVDLQSGDADLSFYSTPLKTLQP